MQTANQVFSLAARTIAVTDHPLIKRAGLGFTLQQPFGWSLINSAAVLARMLDEYSFAAESLESEAVRDEMLASDINLERVDQLIIKLATLRHFNRMTCGTNEIGMGMINACLKPDDINVDLEAIKQSARDRIKIERRMGKLKPQLVQARFNELVTKMYETETARKNQVRRLMDEVFFLCNRSDDMLFMGAYELQLEANQIYSDAELADVDQYAYLTETLAEKCVEPVIRAKDELQGIMDRSFRTQVLRDGTELMKEIDKLAIELGINFAKIDAENAKIDAEIAQAEAVDKDVEAEIDNLDVDIQLQSEALPANRERRTVKSPERLAREAEELAAATQRQEAEAKNKARATKTAATRAANKATAQASQTAS